MSELKKRIQDVLASFASGNLSDNAKALLNVLRYESDRTVQLSPNNYRGFSELFQPSAGNFNPDKAKVQEWQSVDIIFQLTEDDIKKNHSLFEATKVDNAIIESYLFFAVALTGSSYARGDLVKITREINRLTPMPAMVFFRYGDCLTVAIIDRRLHKRESAKDVLEKVTLIKDINIANPHRAHIEILDDLALATVFQKHAVANFVALHKAWQKTLDTSELNKRFYRELANWYFWAVQHVEFPADVEEKRDVRNATGVIRLLTRLIFIWFIKEKGLVPHDVFNQTRLKQVLNYRDRSQSTYYKAILQNLFFATLNTEMNKDKPGSRKFRGRRQEGRDQHYMIHNVFRYADLFLKPNDALSEYFENIPFLNGGLFECLDKIIITNGKEKAVRIDGFSERHDNALKVPDNLFFAAEQPVDLNEVYGTKNKTYKVKGLIDILDSYKFTIDENTPVEEEIALDPELLGKVFENLLASYNPETQTTARKQTGSFYTPREIVNYMVDESLIACLPSKVAMADGDARIRHLLSYTEEPHQFADAEVDALIDAIDDLKILDPACGSGAFPMGILHKLAFILGKLDPHNDKWREKQRQKAIKETEEAYRIGEQEERQKRLLDIDDAFENNASDYGRKLYLIENCIFGVDIQPIAVQIAKLRFFISLIVDQQINPDRGNHGVRPLPNLETKFVAANTLIGIEKPKVLHLSMNLVDIERTEKELKMVRERHFAARTQQTKNKWRDEDKRLRSTIAELLKEDGWDNEVARKLAEWNPYDQNASAAFFDPKWMFGITDGFDVVIGNPPYVRHEAIKDSKPQLQKQFAAFYCGTADLYTYFYKRGLEMLKPSGHLCFIAPNKFMRTGYGKNTRRLLAGEATPKVVIDFGELPVFEAGTDPSIILVEKKKAAGEMFTAAIIKTAAEIERVQETVALRGFRMPASALSADGWTLEHADVLALMEKMRSTGTPLGEYVEGKLYYGIKTGLNEAFVIDLATRQRLIDEDPKSAELIRPWLRGRDIRKWKAEWAGLYIIAIASSANREWPWSVAKKEKDARKIFAGTYPAVFAHLSVHEEKLRIRDDQGQFWWELRSCAYYHEFEKPKIIYPIVAKDMRASFDEQGYLHNDKCFMIPRNDLYLMAVMNSRLMDYYFRQNFAGHGDPFKGGRIEFRGIFMEMLPVFPAADTQRAPIVERVQTILAAPGSPDVPRLEAEIDKLVYALYGLTPEEITLIEGRK
ncbi:MAG: hypothetical protein FD164_2181 [Nitrospirae bacterium]|nr:MAG: hypothetical protein FD164_2181 [Nitrospirota bacterium]